MRQIDEELLKPEVYPERTSRVKLIQTHISFVFITDNFVYKVKKPVDFGFLDFYTLRKRRYYCEKEVELNRRLSPDVYLGVVKITDEGDGLVIDGDGEAVDYAVKMKKLPSKNLMLNLLEKGKLEELMIHQVAKKIAKFHDDAATNKKIDEFGSIGTIKKNTDENFQQTKKYVGKTITRDQFNIIKKYTENFYKNKEKFIKRIDQKKIRDCHGDLHLEHIYLMEPIAIIDCIEFNERFRYSDTAADVAFLAMDLDFHGYPEFSTALVNSYAKYSGDDDIYEIIDFYKIYRAFVRGKVIGFRLDDPNISKEDKENAASVARKYFSLAESYVKSTVS